LTPAGSLITFRLKSESRSAQRKFFYLQTPSDNQAKLHTELSVLLVADAAVSYFVLIVSPPLQNCGRPCVELLLFGVHFG
jgi:hypothetical protein